MSLSLYAQYLQEKSDIGIYETKGGFATFKYLSENEVYILDMYIEPEYRRQKLGTFIGDVVCKEALTRGCKTLISTINISHKNPEDALKFHLSYGLKIFKLEGSTIFLKKDLVGGE